MKLRSTLLFTGAAGACLFTVSCMTPSQQIAAFEVLDQLRDAGALTDAQFAELRRSIVEAGSANFWQVLVGNAASIALSLMGVRAARGPSATPDERVVRRLARKR